jgi:C4-dicarboxylate transporter DctM subunit
MIELEVVHESGPERLNGAATRLETLLVVVISSAMMVLPVLEIVLRRFGSGVPGGSVYVQHLTLWVGFLGALLATLGGRHLGLATTGLLPSERAKSSAMTFGAFVAAVTTFALAYASFRVVQAGRDSSVRLAGGIPEWWSQAIVPVTLALMGVRFLGHAPGGRLGRIALAAVAMLTLLGFVLAGDHVGLIFWPGILLISAAFLLGAPVFVAMSGAAMLLFLREGAPIAAVPTETLRLLQNPTLPAIPLLTLAGYVLASGRASDRLVRAYKSLFGWLPGGVAIMAISVCALFTTFTGGSGVTILALGGVLSPALKRDRYPEGFSLGLVTAAGSLGLLFPPSLPVILYGAVAGVAADRLYLGGFVPGVLLMAVVSIFSIRIAIKAGAPRQRFEVREVLAALSDAKWDLGLPVLVLGVFVTGWSTIVEAAALGAAYAVAVELVVFRDTHWLREMPKVFVSSATLVGAVVILLGVALGFTSYLVDAEIPDALITWVQAHFHSQWSFLLALNGLLLVLGSIFEIYAAIIVLAPLIAPLGKLFSVDPVHLGVVFLANLELGFLFPPMGLNLLLSASRFGRPLPFLYRQALPFLLIMAGGVLLITYVPALTTGVVALMSR